MRSSTDVQTVLLHKMGHSLGPNHFARLFRTDANNKLRSAPLAVMNVNYTGMQQELTDTNTVAFCNLWATGPLQ